MCFVQQCTCLINNLKYWLITQEHMHHQSYEPSFDFQPDSFDQPLPSDNQYQIQNQHVPAAIPSDHYIDGHDRKGGVDQGNNKGKSKHYREEVSEASKNSYEVTFKKQNNKFKNLRANQQIKANLFTKQSVNDHKDHSTKNRQSRSRQVNNQNNPQTDHNHNKILPIIQNSQSVHELLTKILHPPIIMPISILEYALQSLLQADDLVSEISQLKVQTLLNAISLTNLRKKRNSVRINLAIMSVQMDGEEDGSVSLDNKQTKKSNNKSNNSKNIVVSKKQFNEADRKKMQILSLLKIQLDKKIFIEALKFERLRGFCDKVLQQVAENQQNAEEDVEIQEQYDQQQEGEQQQQQQEQEQHNEFLDKKFPPVTSTTPNYSPSHIRIHAQHQSSPYYQQSRLTVFTQIISSLLNKRVFYASFRNIRKQAARIITESDSLGRYIAPNDDQLEFQPEKYDDDQEYQDGGHDGQANVDKDPVEAIEQYIEQLKHKYIKQPSHKLEIMRNYFLRWKIYFLTTIVNKIQSQLSISQQQQQQQQQQYQQERQQYNQQLQQNNDIYQQLDPRINKNRPNRHRQQQLQYQYELLQQFASNKSIQTNNNTLKDQKCKLKQYIHIKRVKEFFNICRESIANRNIKLVMKGYYRRSLKMKVFQALWNNKQQAVIQENAQYLAENQNQQQMMTALIFYRTNILAKSFFGLKKLTKYTKFSNITERFLIKQSYHCLKYQTTKQRDTEIKINKFLQRKRRLNLFKYFNGIKSETSFSNELNSKIEGFKNKKQQEIVQLCFSALNLAWKKRFAKIRKIQNLRTVSSAKMFLSNLSTNIFGKFEEQDLYLKASYVVLFNKKCQFMSNLKKEYVKFLHVKRLSIQSTKFEIHRVYNQAYQMLTNWHKSYINLKNYELIEQKLKKVKQQQQKQKLLKIWHNRLLQKYKQKRKDKLTSNHKIWLNKYYQKLCAFEQESGNQDLVG